jgi:hypothetical protein
MVFEVKFCLCNIYILVIESFIYTESRENPALIITVHQLSEHGELVQHTAEALRISIPHQIDQIHPRRNPAEISWRSPMRSPVQFIGPFPQQRALRTVPTPGRNTFRMKRRTAQRPLVGLIVATQELQTIL